MKTLNQGLFTGWQKQGNLHKNKMAASIPFAALSLAACIFSKKQRSVTVAFLIQAILAHFMISG